MDFSIASVSIQEVKSVGVFFCPSNKVIFELSYKGNGIFEGEGKVTFKQESWGKDQRYKLLMSYSDKDMYWGTLNDVDSSPNGAGQELSLIHISLYFRIHLRSELERDRFQYVLARSRQT